MRTQKRSFCKDTDAVTEVIGEVLLTAIAVLAFSVIAVFVFSYAGPQERVHADIDGWVNVDSDSIIFRHAGGESIELEKTRIILNLNGTREELSSDELKSLKGSDTWQLGEMISINTSSTWNIPINENDTVSATIVHSDSNMVIKSGTLLGLESTSASNNDSGGGNVTPPVPPVVSIPSDMIAWWKFNENAGTLASDQINGYDADIEGATWTTGINGSALLFDGIDDYAESDQNIVSDYPFTISAWVKTTHSGSDQAIANLARSSKEDRYYGTYVDTNGKAALVASNTAPVIISGSTVNDGDWHHIVGVFTSQSERDLYVDGKHNGTSSISVSIDNAANRWDFGRLGIKTESQYFDGSIDEIKLWDRALNATEVELIYQNP